MGTLPVRTRRPRCAAARVAHRGWVDGKGIAAACSGQPSEAAVYGPQARRLGCTRLADGFDFTSISALRAAAIASIPAALSVVKGAIGTVIGDPTTAGWLPRGSR